MIRFNSVVVSFVCALFICECASFFIKDEGKEKLYLNRNNYSNLYIDGELDDHDMHLITHILPGGYRRIREIKHSRGETEWYLADEGSGSGDLIVSYRIKMTIKAAYSKEFQNKTSTMFIEMEKMVKIAFQKLLHDVDSEADHVLDLLQVSKSTSLRNMAKRRKKSIRLPSRLTIGLEVRSNDDLTDKLYDKLSNKIDSGNFNGLLTVPGSLDFLISNPSCEKDEFQCEDKTCINADYVCDEDFDCPDSSDEINCLVCEENEFQCIDLNCINSAYYCNGIEDCPDGSDEAFCEVKCSDDEWRCDNGKECVPKLYVCDQVVDCTDGSDESNDDCGAKCMITQWRCDSQDECIDASQFCDNVVNCADGSDEQDCPESCGLTKFLCRSGECLEWGKYCNGLNDCKDGSDEIHCSVNKCDSTEFTCDDGTCIDYRLRCDGTCQCPDLSDEKNCQSCPSGWFYCKISKCCIANWKCCNGVVDCPFGEDEFTYNC